MSGLGVILFPTFTSAERGPYHWKILARVFVLPRVRTSLSVALWPKRHTGKWPYQDRIMQHSQ